VYYAEVSAGYWLKVFSLELGTGAWIQKKKLEGWGYRVEKEV